MDLLGTLVRLEAAGWEVLPPPAKRPDGLPREFGRLLRRAGGLAREGRVYRFVDDELPPAWFAPGSRFRRSLGDGLVAVEVGGSVWVFELADAPHRVRWLARGLVPWLEQLLEPSPAVEVEPEEREGQPGWDAASLPLPAVLIVPEGMERMPIQVEPDRIWLGAEDPPAPKSPPDRADRQVEALFGGEGPRPRTALIGTLLALGLLLTVLGMACINAPGGLLVLWAWMLVERDLERVESGYFPEADREEVERMRALTYAGLQLVVVLFFLQALLLCFGAYDRLLDEVYIPVWRSFVTSLLGEGPT